MLHLKGSTTAPHIFAEFRADIESALFSKQKFSIASVAI